MIREISFYEVTSIYIGASAKYFGAILFWCTCISFWHFQHKGQYTQILPNLQYLMDEISIGIFNVYQHFLYAIS